MDQAGVMRNGLQVFSFNPGREENFCDYLALLKDVITYNPTSPQASGSSLASQFCPSCQKDHKVVGARRRICA